ncbi:MAG: hypothetical protein IT477_10300 [Rhodanobacteraceae bacterium]|nr:hypothetical protein [Rhodanobacteraceae bacterium]
MTPEDFALLPEAQQIAFVSRPDLTEAEARVAEEGLMQVWRAHGVTRALLAFVQNPGLEQEEAPRIVREFVIRTPGDDTRAVEALLNAYGQNQANDLALLTGTLTTSMALAKLLADLPQRHLSPGDFRLPLGLDTHKRLVAIVERCRPYLRTERQNEDLTSEIRRTWTSPRSAGPWVGIRNVLESALKRAWAADVRGLALYLVALERIAQVVPNAEATLRLERAPAFWALVLDLSWDRLLPEGEPG